MRTLRDPADAASAPEHLRELLLQCLARWSEAGIVYDPSDAGPLILVEPGDSLEEIGAYVGMILDPGSDDFLSFEWIADRGPCYEACSIFTDDGAGWSLIVPKDSGIDGRLLALAESSTSSEPMSS